MYNYPLATVNPFGAPMPLTLGDMGLTPEQITAAAQAGGAKLVKKLAKIEKKELKQEQKTARQGNKQATKQAKIAAGVAKVQAKQDTKQIKAEQKTAKVQAKQQQKTERTQIKQTEKTAQTAYQAAAQAGAPQYYQPQPASIQTPGVISLPAAQGYSGGGGASYGAESVSTPDTSTGPFGLPSWAIPAGIGAAVLLYVMNQKPRKKGRK